MVFLAYGALMLPLIPVGVAPSLRYAQIDLSKLEDLGLDESAREVGSRLPIKH